MVFQEDQTISLNLVNHSGITSARNNYRRKERENIPVGCKPPAYPTVSWNNSLGVPVQSGPSWTSLNMLGWQGPVQKGLGPGSCTERAMVRALCRRGRGPCLRGCQDPGWWDRPPPIMDRMTDTHDWKHHLPATLLASGTCNKGKTKADTHPFRFSADFLNILVVKTKSGRNIDPCMPIPIEIPN